MGGSDTPGSDDEVVLLRHPPGGLDDLILVIGNDFDLLEFDTEVKALLGEKVTVRVAVKEPNRISFTFCLSSPI
jgi:hypothetical protein